MNPANPHLETFPIYKGAKWQHIVRFVQTGTIDSVDLTGLGPFVATIDHGCKDEDLADALVEVDDDPTTGLVKITLTAEQTSQLPLGHIRFGFRDALNNPYIACTVPVRYFSPAPL